MDRSTIVLWGETNVGKSTTAWKYAGWDAYPKDPRSKFWCGYQGQENVVIDEFRGGIDIAHMLRILDKFPMIIELKGYSTVLKAKNIWITSNLHPKDWYPDLDRNTYMAFARRLRVLKFPEEEHILETWLHPVPSDDSQESQNTFNEENSQ